MSSFRLRPCFSHVVNLGMEATRDKIVSTASADAARCEVKSFPGFICLRIPEQERHYWSPRLNLSLEEEGERRTRVHGTYGPNANMWSSFLYGYLLLGTGSLFACILGCCQFCIGLSPWGLWIFGLLVAMMAGMYVLAQMGQKLAAQQIFTLHQIYEAAVADSVEVH